MKTFISTILAILLFGSAMLLSSRGVPESARSSASQSKERQVKVLEVTSEYRVVKHALGQTKVPLSPLRIVSLSTFITDNLVAMGIRPVAVEGSSWHGETGKPAPHLIKYLSDVPVVSSSGTLNLEAIAEAKPDLILAGSTENSRWYSHLSLIAPTVVFSTKGMTPQREAAILDIGDIIGCREKADMIQKEYQEKILNAKQLLAEKIGSKPVVYLRFRKQTCVIYSLTPMIGPLLFDKLGLTPDPMISERSSPGGWDVLSLERLSRLQAEYIFYTVDRDSELYLQDIKKSPIWRTIPAVQHGHAFHVSRSIWFGQGVLACEGMIDDVLAAAAQP